MNYKHYFSTFLGISLAFSIVAPSHAALPQLKKSFSHSVKDFVKCLKGDQSCDPKKIRAYRAALALASAVVLAATGAGIYGIYSWRKKKITPQTEIPSSSIKTQPITPPLQKVQNPEADRELMIAAYTDNLERAKKAFAQGANIEQPDESGRTPLLKAAAGGSPEVLKWLLDKGAKIDSHDDEGQSALALAKSSAEFSKSDPQRYQDYLEVFKILQEAGLKE